MALDIEQLKNPKVLIIVGGALVGGLYLSTKLKGKSSSDNAPIEVPISNNPIIDSNQVERENATTRELAEAKAKQEELIKKQEEERTRLTKQLNSQSALAQTEREALQTRLEADKAALTSRYDTQLSQLQEMIKRLEDQLKNGTVKPPPFNQVQPQPQEPISQPIRTGGPNTPSQPSQPIYQPSQPIYQPSQPQPQAPQIVIKRYPGLADNYKMDCAGKPTALKFSNFDAAVADQKRKNISSATFLARNMVTIAIAGGTSPWLIGFDVAQPGDPRRAQINNSRVYWGLMPLTEEQMTELSNHMRQLWPFNTMPEPQRTNTFNNLNAYARPLWERWNLPYQCTGSVARY